MNYRKQYLTSNLGKFINDSVGPIFALSSNCLFRCFVLKYSNVSLSFVVEKKKGSTIRRLYYIIT